MDKKVPEVKISPLRSLDDFLLKSAQFQIPNFKDFEKWGNRVTNNLLYYQTNYFMLAFIIFLIVGVLHPVDMCCGIIAVTVAFGLFYHFTNASRSAARIKKDYPILGAILSLGGGYLIVYFLDSVVVFLFGVLLPVMVIFVHASMRLRNLKNKVLNRLETVGYKRTPMGVFLEALAAWSDTAEIMYGRTSTLLKDEKNIKNK